MGPKKDVCVQNNYHINNFNFHTRTYGKDKSTMNYWVCVKSVDGVEYYGFYKRSSNSPTLVQMLAIKCPDLNMIGLTPSKGKTYTDSISLLRSIMRGITESMAPLFS